MIAAPYLTLLSALDPTMSLILPTILLELLSIPLLCAPCPIGVFFFGYFDRKILNACFRLNSFYTVTSCISIKLYPPTI